MRWDVSGVRITRVVEFVMPFPVDFFAEATPADVAAEAWLVPDFVNADGHYLMRFHTFVIEDGAWWRCWQAGMWSGCGERGASRLREVFSVWGSAGRVLWPCQWR